MGKGDWNAASAMADELTHLLPDDALAAYKRGVVHWQLVQLPQAAYWLRKARDLQPGLTQASLALAEVTRQFNKQLLEAEEAQAAQPPVEVPDAEAVSLDPDALFSLACEHVNNNERDKALALIERAILLRPDFAAAIYSRGMLLVHQGDTDGAQHTYSVLKAMDATLGKYLLREIAAEYKVRPPEDSETE